MFFMSKTCINEEKSRKMAASMVTDTYSRCSHCSGLFENSSLCAQHQHSCDGSLSSSSAELFAIDRNLFMALQPLRKALGVGALKTDIHNIKCSKITTKRGNQISVRTRSDGNRIDETRDDRLAANVLTQKAATGKGMLREVANSRKLKGEEKEAKELGSSGSDTVVEEELDEDEDVKYVVVGEELSDPTTVDLFESDTGTSRKLCRMAMCKRRGRPRAGQGAVTKFEGKIRLKGARGAAGWKYTGQKKLYANNHKIWEEIYRDMLVVQHVEARGHGGVKEEVSMYQCNLCPFSSPRIGFFNRHMLGHCKETAIHSCPKDVSARKSAAGRGMPRELASCRKQKEEEMVQEAKELGSSGSEGYISSQCEGSESGRCGMEEENEQEDEKNLVGSDNSDTVVGGEEDEKGDVKCVVVGEELPEQTTVDFSGSDAGRNPKLYGMAKCKRRGRPIVGEGAISKFGRKIRLKGARGSAGGKYAGQKTLYAKNHKIWTEMYQDMLVVRHVEGGGEGVKEEGEEVSMYQCNLCSFSSPRIGFFNRHMLGHGKETAVHSCPVCPYRCDSRGRLNKHANLHIKPFMCEFCSACFAEKRDMERHTWIHTDYLPFSCPDCEYKCRYKNILEDHRRKHTGEKFQCLEPGCEFTTYYKIAFENHRIAKHTLSEYQCDKCHFNTQNRNKYYRHIMLHDGANVKVYQCMHCSYRANFKNDLTRHIRKHTREKVYFCDMCDYSAAYAASLRLHLMQHFGYKPWRCTACDHHSFTKQKMVRHIASKHPDSGIKPDVVEEKWNFELSSFRRSNETQKPSGSRSTIKMLVYNKPVSWTLVDTATVEQCTDQKALMAPSAEWTRDEDVVDDSKIVYYCAPSVVDMQS